MHTLIAQLQARVTKIAAARLRFAYVNVLMSNRQRAYAVEPLSINRQQAGGAYVRKAWWSQEIVATLYLMRGDAMASKDGGAAYSLRQSFPIAPFPTNWKPITALAHELSLEVIAQGVESRRYLDFCKEIGCDEAQGFQLGAPVPAVQFSAPSQSRMKRAGRG